MRNSNKSDLLVGVSSVPTGAGGRNAPGAGDRTSPGAAFGTSRRARIQEHTHHILPTILQQK